MSVAKQGTEDAPLVDVILQNLAKRPNVRSTLILSRKDGSIIKASGVITDDTPTQAQDRRKEDPVQDQDESVELEEPAVTRAQVLASSIHGFVAAAVVLGESIQSVDNGSSVLSGRPGIEEDNQAGTTTVVDKNAQADDVQLLRLRLKRQEIIIFPDSKYLCCVVQDLEKSTR